MRRRRRRVDVRYCGRVKMCGSNTNHNIIIIALSRTLVLSQSLLLLLLLYYHITAALVDRAFRIC